jgi:hypothetical protein
MLRGEVRDKLSLYLIMPTADAVASRGNERKSSPRVVMRPMLRKRRKRYEIESRKDEIVPICIIQTAKIPALMRLPGVEHVRQRQVTFATIASH